MDKEMYNDEYRKEWAVEILRLLTEKQNHLREVKRLTDEMSECLDRNDRVSADMLLRMRGKELEDTDMIVRNLSSFKQALTLEAQQEIDEICQGSEFCRDLPEMEKISVAAKSCEKLLKDIVLLDEKISRRVAGADSFYNK